MVHIGGGGDGEIMICLHNPADSEDKRAGGFGITDKLKGNKNGRE